MKFFNRRMSELRLAIMTLLISIALCTPEKPRIESMQESMETDEINDIDGGNLQVGKRSENDLKRAYSYVSEYKRLPVYNFGLGKRSDDTLYDIDTIDNNELLDQILDDLNSQTDLDLKRSRTYNFGLGKRMPYDKKLKHYEFGLGKRIPIIDAVKRTSIYQDMGKRINPGNRFNFGLGKRFKEGSRFNFGLGKRTNDFDSNEFDNI